MKTRGTGTALGYVAGPRPVSRPDAVRLRGMIMASVTIDVPIMFADHHVVEVRRLLFETAGVENVNASSAFQVVQVDYDAETTSEDALRKTLDDAGYLGELSVSAESGDPAVGRDGTTFFRHSAAYETAGTAVSFAQDISSSGKALWPCPGMGPLPQMDE